MDLDFFDHFVIFVYCFISFNIAHCLYDYKKSNELDGEKVEILVNQAQKVQDAANLFILIQDKTPTETDDLVGEYIDSIPELPMSLDGTTWTLENAKNRYNKTVGIVTVELPIVASREFGVTKNICEAINDNGAGILFCTVSKHGVFNERNLTAGEGSAESVIDDIREDLVTAKAKIHMVI